MALNGMGSEILVVLLSRTDVVLVGWLLTKADAGSYAVALSVTELLWIVPHGVSHALAPRVAQRSEPDTTARTSSTVLVLSVIGAIGISVLTPPLLPVLFGDQYEVSFAVVTLLCAGAVSLGMWRVIAADLTGRGLTRSRRRSTSTSLVLLVVLVLALTPTLELVGTALAVAVAYLVAAVTAARDWSRATNCSVMLLVDIRRGLASLRAARFPSRGQNRNATS